jgi:hypothetical protein
MNLIAMVMMMLASRLTAALPGQILDITADNFFIRAPATARPGLTTIRLTSPHGGHQFELYRLDQGHSASDLVAALTADKSPAWATELGGAGFPPKGGTVNASYVLEPGKYAIVCAVHDNTDGLRHYQKGMFTELTVAGRRVPGKLPTPDVTVSEVEYKWNFSKPLTAGRHVLKVTNDGSQVHEMKIVRVLPGHTYAEVKAWKRGQPRVDEPYATVTVMSPGVSVITSVNFKRGDYVLFCIPQMKNGMMQP